MALAFPLALADLWDMLPAEAVTFDCPPQVEHSQTAGGEVLRRQLGPSLWRGSISTYGLAYQCGRKVQSRLIAARQAGGSFIATPKNYDGPALRGAAAYPAATLQSVAANNRDVTLAGLTFALSPGDYLGWSYGSPSRLALHQVVAGSGSTYEVTPPVRSGWSANAPVTLNRPTIKAVILPDTTRVGETTRVASGPVSFDFIQTLR